MPVLEATDTNEKGLTVYARWMHVKLDGLVHCYVEIDLPGSLNWALFCGMHVPRLEPTDHTDDMVTCIGCAIHTEGKPHPWNVMTGTRRERAARS